MTEKEKTIASFMQERFPDAKCALIFSNPFECIVAVVLSAQTTDASVNKVTPTLFARFPDAFAMSNAKQEDIEECIHSLGLYRNKAKNLIALSKDLVARFDRHVPSKREDLVTLAGVGIKTANVVGAECFNTPAIAVDTHVTRVATRLGYAKKDMSPEKIEIILEKKFPKELHIKLHHQLIWFGREICVARNPHCEECKLHAYCSLFKKSASTAGK